MIELVLLLGVVAVGVLVTGSSSGNSPVASWPGQCLNRERLEGLDPRLIAAVDAWEREGSFRIRVADDPKLPPGGVRTATDQDLAVSLGLTHALDLEQTPHGRGGAVDLWPESFNPWQGLTVQPLARAQFLELIAFMEQKRGLVAGVHFVDIIAPDGTRGDWPHFQVPNWKQLPFPPNPRGVA